MTYKEAKKVLDTMQGEPVSVPVERLVFRPSAYGILIQEGSVLVVKTRSADKFFFPGGGVEVDEVMTEGLQREFMEEVGIVVEVGDLFHFEENFFYYQPTDGAWHGLLFFYFCSTREAVDEGRQTPDPHEKEVASIHWVRIAELQEDDFLNSARSVVRALRTVYIEAESGGG